MLKLRCPGRPDRAQRAGDDRGQHPLPDDPDKYGYENTLISHVAIGDRCWIAAKAAVLHGVEIGDDVVVAAGSVVTKNLPVGVLAGGIPARVLAENYSGAPGS
ncbi:MAG: hypothetical protein IPM90_00015 [Austwickia sp.]|nr:hypothetical protein [Austwickia sp.]